MKYILNLKLLEYATAIYLGVGISLDWLGYATPYSNSKGRITSSPIRLKPVDMATLSAGVILIMQMGMGVNKNKMVNYLGGVS